LGQFIRGEDRQIVSHLPVAGVAGEGVGQAVVGVVVLEVQGCSGADEAAMVARVVRHRLVMSVHLLKPKERQIVLIVRGSFDGGENLFFHAFPLLVSELVAVLALRKVPVIVFGFKEIDVGHY
jgi:hypothetical protein